MVGFVGCSEWLWVLVVDGYGYGVGGRLILGWGLIFVVGFVG